METDWATQIVIRRAERDELIALRDSLDLPDVDMQLNNRLFDKRWELTISIHSPEGFAAVSDRIAAVSERIAESQRGSWL